MQARSSLFTIFGEFVHPRGDAAWVGTIIAWMAELGFSEPAVRAAVSRSSRTGWLEVKRVGRRSYYALTPGVRWRVHRAVGRLYRPLDAPWDGLWRVLAYNIPEELRAERDRFRKELSVLGFGAYQNGVWISPNDLAGEALELARVHGLTGYVDVFESRRLGGRSNLELVTGTWDIAALNAGFERFLGEFSKEPTVTRQNEAFSAYVRVLHEYRKFLFVDPDLPIELQPPVWRSLEAARLFRSRRERLAPLFEAFVRQSFEGLPEADPDLEPINWRQ
jgi:phenylacetic acid degradation operon negative regulatory protein